MKPYLLPIIVLGLAIGLGFATAYADANTSAQSASASSVGQAAQTPDWGGRPHGMKFEDMDTDHDGYIEKSEAQHGVLKNFDAIDTDHDGKISRDELRAWRMARMKDHMGDKGDAPQPH